MYSQHVHDRNAEPTPYWRAIHGLLETEAFRRDPVYITSEEDQMRGLKGGVTFEAMPRNAAERVISRTHRLSTPEEIEAYKRARATEVRRLHDIEEARKQTSIMKPSPEQNEAMAGAVAAAVQAVLQNQQGEKKRA